MALTINSVSNQKDEIGSEVVLPLSINDAGNWSDISYSATGLPHGLLLNAKNGQIRGTAKAAGTFTVNVSVSAVAAGTGQNRESVSTSFKWVIFKSSASIDSIADQRHHVNEKVELVISAPGGNYTWTATGLPQGLSIARIDGNTAMISGKPTQREVCNQATVTANDNTLSIPVTHTKSFIWKIIRRKVKLYAIEHQEHFEGEDVHLPVRSRSANVTYSAKKLPPGLTIGTANGVISGTATKAGKYKTEITITHKKRNNDTDTKRFNWVIQETLDVSEKWFKVETPNYNESDDANAMRRSYLRMGSPDADYEKSFMLGGSAYVKGGWLEYTDGDRVVETQLDRYTLTHGDEYHLVEGSVEEVVEGEYWKWTDQFNYEFKLGLDTEVAFAGQFSSLIGAAAEFFLGPKYEASIGLGAVSTNLGFEITHGASWKYEATIDSDITLCREIEGEANDKIHYTVDPDDTGWEKYFETAAPILASVGVGLVGIPAAVASGIDIAARATTKHEGWNEGLSTAAKATASVGHAASVATWLFGVITAAADAIRRRKKKDDPRTELLMDKDRIELALKQPVVPGAGLAAAGAVAAAPVAAAAAAGAPAAAAAAAGPPATEGRAIQDPDALISMEATQISLKCGESAEIIINDSGDIELKGQNIIIGQGVTGDVTISPMGNVNIKPTQSVDITPTGACAIKGIQRIV